MSSWGVIYYATGAQYVAEATRSARSLKEHNDIDVTIFTDQNGLDRTCFDCVEQIDPGEHPFYDRINYFKESPYDRTLHLDTDTIVIGDIKPIFEMLERFEVVAAINETRHTASKDHKFDTVNINAPEAFPEYQCGVIGFCNTRRVRELFDDWQQRYANYLDDFVLDQPFFREAVYNSEIDIGTLPSEFNALLYMGGYFEQEVRIVHLAGKKPETLSVPFLRYKNTSKAVKLLNANVPERRVLFYDSWNRLIVKPTNGNQHRFFWLLKAVERNGILWASRRAIEKTHEKFKSLLFSQKES